MTFCLIMGGGLALWREEHDEVALWTTEDSRIRLNSQWVDRHFSDDVRYESVIVTAENVLTPDVLLFMTELDASVKGITTSNGYQWDDVCARFGTALKGKEDPSKRRRRSISDETSVSAEDASGWSTADSTSGTDDFDLSALDFSGIFENGDNGDDSSSGGLFGSTRANHLINLLSTPDNCLFRNILEIWDSDPAQLRGISSNQVLRDVNDALSQGNNQSFLDSYGFLLSDTEVDADGQVIKAGATLMTWLLDTNQLNSSIYDQWERLFVERTIHGNLSIPSGVHVYSLASKSYEEALAETLTSNLTILMAGFSLIIFYFSFAMGKFNWIEQRLLLSIVGVSVVGQAILASYGLCFYLNVFYGPVHPTIPFLLLGIGVDDMFVIIQALDNLTSDEKQRPIPERMALALRHAGVSITVTSVTDIAAFAIGATTSMPALRSFCINATAGIFMLFILEVTFFVALTVLDERRKEQRRIGCCLPPPKKDAWTPSSCSQRELLKVFFDQFYGPFLLKTPVKVIILLITAASVGVNIWGILQLEQNFDPNWYLKEHSYPAEYFDALKQYFPEIGERASIYTGRIDYIREREQLNRMVQLLRSDPYVKSTSIVYWYEDFQNWLNQTGQDFPVDEMVFKQTIQEYLFSPDGRHYLQDIKVDGSILDLESNFTITGSRARFRHLSMHNSSTKNAALESITSLSNKIYFGDDAQPPIPIVYTYTYVEWEANKVISSELIRNLGLTMVAVVGVTLVFISDLVTVFWVITCVAFTLIDLLGLMYYWGLTVEIASSIIVILAAGLAIDYSAHIGHTFTTISGSKSRRARLTLTRMGPAVWNGGFSTFLAFVLLVNTDSHIFTTFFKLFFGVVVFGLFHGLAYLPVVLSWFGPAEKDLTDHADFSTVGDSSFNSSPDRPSSTASSDDLSAAKNKPVIHSGKTALALDNPAFISDHFQILYDARYGYEGFSQYHQEFSTAPAIMDQKPARKSLRRMQPEDQDVPYIPQPDYTPTLPRRVFSTQATYLTSVQMLPRIAKSGNGDLSGDLRVWHNPQWGSSQFPASDWNAALMKRISEEAQLRRVDRIRQEADQTLDQFESEMDSYLEDDRSSEQTTQQHSSSVIGASVATTTEDRNEESTPVERSPGSSSSSSSSSASSSSTLHSNSVEDVTTTNLRRDRDQESLESGYLSSYPGYLQRPNSGIY